MSGFRGNDNKNQVIVRGYYPDDLALVAGWMLLKKDPQDPVEVPERFEYRWYDKARDMSYSQARWQNIVQEKGKQIVDGQWEAIPMFNDSMPEVMYLH